MRAALVFFVTVALMTTACGNESGEDGGVGSGAGEGDLRGRTFLSQNVTGRDLVAETQLRITFNEDGTLSASAGCNQFVGDLDIDGDALVVTNLAGTEMGCDPPRHAQDAWFSEFLAARPTYQLADGDLTLSGGDVTIDLLDRRVAEPDLDLVGTRWVVDTILEGDAASSIPAGAEAFLVFDADRRWSGGDGCNELNGEYERAGGTIRFENGIQTDMACSGDVLRLADAVGAATSGEVSFTISAKRLTLTGADGRGISATGTTT